jgi:hypothetical protein
MHYRVWGPENKPRLIHCDMCEEEFLCPAAEFKTRARHYCSTACRVIGRTLDLIANSGQMRPKPGRWLSNLAVKDSPRFPNKRRAHKKTRVDAQVFLVAGEGFEPSTSGL